MSENQAQIDPKRQLPTEWKGESKKPRKRTKKQNPFEELAFIDDDKPINEGDWHKPKTTPLTISIANHTKINRFYSHKSLQKYMRYLYAGTCPNPLWLSIKRQSQIFHIGYIDIQIENTLFQKYLAEEQEGGCLQFLKQFNVAERKAIFRESQFVKSAQDVWEALFSYDQQSIKPSETEKISPLKQLQPELTEQLYNKYLAYILTPQEMKNNLYPMVQLPAYKHYADFRKSDIETELKNKILMVDCQMVMSQRGFQLARVSIMNFNGETIYDKYFKPKEPVTNYNTIYSGITKEHLENVTNNLETLHADLKQILGESTILVGHSLQNDLHAMNIFYDRVIDTSVLFARKNGSKMKLKTIALQLLHRIIQAGSHCSEEDCRATLDILRYRIQIQGNKEREKEYNLLEELIQAKKSILLIDSEIDSLKHQQSLNPVHFEKCMPDSSPKEILQIAMKYFQKDIRHPDIFFTRIRYQQQQWQKYYQEINAGFKNLYEKCPKGTVFFLNCQVNNFYRIYPQSESEDSRRAFCLICVKNQ